MADPLDAHVAALLDDARAAAAGRDWASARRLASAVLALQPGQDEAQAIVEEADERNPDPGERRQLTIMFCDVVGSTSLSESNDPEVLREVFRAYQRLVDGAIRQFDGRIANYIGDGVLAYFGHPTVHEDDPRRGVLAGLEILEGLGPVADQARRQHGIDLSVRVAVHTGLVVRADMGTTATPSRNQIVGEAPNVAARLQDAARPGTLVISEATRQLVAGYFVTVPLGELALKGFSRPIGAHEVIAVDTEGTRLGAQPALSPFVGRLSELATLEERWHAAESGTGHAVVLRGEAGIGKSRLAEELRERVALSGRATLSCAASAFHTNTDLYAARRLVSKVVGLDEASARVSSPLAALRTSLANDGLEDETAVLGALLGLAPEPWCPAPELDGSALRERTMAAVCTWVTRAALRAPLLLMVEDAQWADPSSIELVGRLVESASPGLLLLLTARDGFAPPWPAVEVIDLERLPAVDLRRLANTLPGGDELPPGQLADLVQRSDGNPLFLEELVRAAQVPLKLEQTLRPSSSIPAPLRDLLLARFAEPSIDLDLAQTLATIGHEVPHDLLVTVTGLDDATLVARLQGLLDARLLDHDGGDPPVYRFHHHLLAEMAYETQLLPARQERHRQVADALLTVEPDRVADAGVVAYHLDLAGRVEEAVDAHLATATGMQERGAYTEATAELSHALGLLPRLDDEEERRVAEVRLLGRRGLSAISTMGYGAPGAAQDFERALQLLRDRDHADDLLIEVQAIWSYYAVRAELDACEAVLRAQPAWSETGSMNQQLLLSWLGLLRFFRGDLIGADRFLPTALGNAELIALGTEMPPDWRLPNEPVAPLQVHIALVAALRGEVGRAHRWLDESLDRAASLPFPFGPFTACYVRSVGVMVHAALGDADAAERLADEMAEIAGRHGYLFWTASASVQRAGVAILRGVPGAPDELAGHLMLLRALGAEVYTSASLTGRALGVLAEGRPEDALALIAEVDEMIARTGVRYWAAEAARARGMAKRALGLPGVAGDLADAVSIAVEQGATLFELRARTELCRITDDDGEHKALVRLVEQADPLLDAELAAAREVLADRSAG